MEDMGGIMHFFEWRSGRFFGSNYVVVFLVLTYLEQYLGRLVTKIFTHLKLCLATAIHNFKWVKILVMSQSSDGIGWKFITDDCL